MVYLLRKLLKGQNTKGKSLQEPKVSYRIISFGPIFNLKGLKKKVIKEKSYWESVIYWRGPWFFLFIFKDNYKNKGASGPEAPFLFPEFQLTEHSLFLYFWIYAKRISQKWAFYRLSIFALKIFLNINWFSLLYRDHIIMKEKFSTEKHRYWKIW